MDEEARLCDQARFRRTRRDRSRPSLHVPACTRDHVRSDLSQSVLYVTRLPSSILISINRARRCVQEMSSLFLRRSRRKLYRKEYACGAWYPYKFFVQLVLREPPVDDTYGGERNEMVPLLLSWIDSQLFRTFWIRVWPSEKEELAQNGAGTERNEMTNVDGMRIRSVLSSCVSCHLSPPLSGSLNFTLRAIHHLLACSIVRSKIMRHYYQQSHLFFFAGDNEHDAIQLAHCVRHLRTKLLLSAHALCCGWRAKTTMYCFYLFR